MKVLHIINTLSAGGAELHLLTLCRHLKYSGVETVVVSLKERIKGSRSLRDDFEVDGIRVFNLNGDGRYSFRFLKPLMELIRRERPDIVHTHLPRADFAFALGRSFCPSVPWVCSIHDVHSESWSARWALPAFSVIWRRPEALIAISYAVKNWLTTEHAIAPEKISVIHYGLDRERFCRQFNNRFRDSLGVNGGPVVGSIGRLEPRKGHACLIRSMARVCERVNGSTLVIAGADTWDYGKELERLIEELGLGGRARLIGFQSDVPSFLGAIDVFAFASRAEGFGQVVIEAMAAGKPVVASRVSPLTEIVVDGETGLLVESENPDAFAEAIEWMLDHPEPAQRMGARGRERVQSSFSAKRMSEQTVAVYNSLL